MTIFFNLFLIWNFLNIILFEFMSIMLFIQFCVIIHELTKSFTKLVTLWQGRVYIKGNKTTEQSHVLPYNRLHKSFLPLRYSMNYEKSSRKSYSWPVGSNQNYKISICCFFAKHVALRRKSKEWLARNQDNVS